ncbi:MAG: MBOAT family protein [Ruminococcaceae bacterium]|nr:MBOAT family protein [Oscillospiraceae bacterium]
MLFSSISFLYLFLPVVLLLYFIVPKKMRNFVLFISSMLFYFFGEPIYTALLIISSLSDYLHGLAIEKCRGTKKAKILLISSIVINLSLLGFFKYADFFIGIVNSILGTSIPFTGVPLPIGISFFTFQTMSYTIDVYRGDVHAEKNLITMATYVCLFPQLIAGPIVRYIDVARELHERDSDLDKVYLGIRRFVYGLGKKVLIANTMGELCAIFRDSGDKSTGFFWIYAIAYTLQIYFDFSGYSDMAIGLGKIFGFHFLENFDYPFISKSITEFWRRWHMSMGGWFRDYLYIPLGGNRVSKGRWFINIAIVWAATGIWHGADWNFILWGVLFGALLIVEKLGLLKLLNKTGRVIPHIYTMLIVVLSFVIFNAAGLPGVIADFKGLFGASGDPFWSFETGYYLKSYALLLVLAIIGSTPIPKMLFNKFSVSKVGQKATAILEPVSVVVIMALVTAFLVNGSFNPFLYFRF